MRINISIWFGSLSIILSLAGCSTASRLSISTPQENASPGITATMSSVTPEPDSSPTHQPPATVESSPTVQPMASYIFLPYGSGGTRAWQVKDKQVSEITLPDMLMNSYDSAPSSGKVLYPSHFPDVGAGPANLSAGDLWVYDIASQQSQQIFTDENIVEAFWAPNGQDFVYLLATPTTYELHWRGQEGEDRLLASDVSPTFSISPDGQQVVFTRETGYKVGTPGVYIVPVSGNGAERKISSIDRGGMGSISDLPLWSPDMHNILLPVSPPDKPPYWALIRTDGSADFPVTMGPQIPEEFRSQQFVYSLWLPDSQHVLGYQIQGMMGPPYAQEIAVATMDLSTGLVEKINPISFKTGFPLTWAIPGKQAWFFTDTGELTQIDLDNPAPLPQACKVSDEQIFVNPFKGYCFSYPKDVTIQAYTYDRPLFMGPPLDQSVEPPQARLWVEANPLPAGTTLDQAVSDFIAKMPPGEPAITRQPTTLGGEPATVLENVPGQLFSRAVLAVHKDMLYQLWFNPVDSSVPNVQSDVERLYQAVTNSFAFLP
jgi:hypothetical protein